MIAEMVNPDRGCCDMGPRAGCCRPTVLMQQSLATSIWVVLILAALCLCMFLCGFMSNRIEYGPPV